MSASWKRRRTNEPPSSAEAARKSFETKITLVGGPTVLIEMSGVRFLTDPTFDAVGEYQSGAIVLKKLKGPAVTAEAIGSIDAVLLSHDQH